MGCTLSDWDLIEVNALFLSHQIENLKRSKVEGWQEAAVRLIRHSRIEDHSQEVLRLKTIGILNQEMESKLDAIIKTNYSYTRNEIPLKAMMGRALEIQKIYQDTHDVFIHAQNAKWLVFVDFVKEWMKVSCPEQDMHQFKFLRMPGFSRQWGIERYSKGSNVNDSDPIANQDLISADGYFYNGGYCESALYFMATNTNIMHSCLSVLIQTIRKAYPDLSELEIEKYARKIFLSSEGNPSNIGNLFVVCIPKQVSGRVQYRSHPFGRPCQCHGVNEERSREILDGLQKGELNAYTSCTGLATLPPQFRLFTPELTKENGVKIYLIPENRKVRKTQKLKIRAIVDELHSSYLGKEKIVSFMNRSYQRKSSSAHCFWGR
jgi:hypothetical protein